MPTPGNVAGIRNGLIANREQRVGSSTEHSNARGSQGYKRVSYSIGRFVVSKKEAKKEPAEIDNPIVDAWRGLAIMNRNRGVAIDIGSLMLQYQTPDQFNERVLARSERSKSKGHLTPKGKKIYVADVKKKIAHDFRELEREDSTHLDELMIGEEQEQRLKEFAKREDEGWYEGMPADKILEEYQDIIIDIPPRGTFADRGFKFSSKLHFDGLEVGLKLKQSDPQTVAGIQNDIDRINDVYDSNGLIFDEFRELRVNDMSLFVPLFTATSVEAADEMYTPYITRQRVPVQNLGIHQLQ